MNDHRQARLSTPIGALTLVATERGLSRVRFAHQDASDVDAAVDGQHPVLAAAASQLREYFAGRRTRFDLALDLVGTEFQRLAWSALADVPYGQTVTYGQQAERIGRPGASRAVGAANAKNPVPIVLPCHRVVGADGSLTGFAGGIEMKATLLSLEREQQSFDFG